MTFIPCSRIEDIIAGALVATDNATMEESIAASVYVPAAQSRSTVRMSDSNV